MEHQDFVDKHSADLISRMTCALSIADKLYERKMLSREMYSEIKDKTSKIQQQRELIIAVQAGGSEVKSYFYKVLKEEYPYLVKDLEDQESSSQTSSGAQQSEGAEAQDERGRPEENLIRWNSSSVQHRSKLEEFWKDPSKTKIGNMYFSRNKYIIGSGSNGIKVYLGLKEDGTEVAIKQILKSPQNSKDFENELKHLQNLNLESKNIVRYVDMAQDEDFFYLAVQLCECDLESYMEDLRTQEHEDKDTVLKKNVKDVLVGLQVLHNAGVIHRDIKPKNVLIDSGKNARLADFGLSRSLEEGSTVYTTRAGTRGWEAVETLDESGNSKYKTSSDVQVAGMLVYYILSDGKHAFDVNNSKDRETSIREGNYSLDDVNEVAQDLIKRMINRDPAERPSIDEALQHPYFWDDVRKDAVLGKLGDREEVQKYPLLRKHYNIYKTLMENNEGNKPTLNEAFDHLKTSNEDREIILKIVKDFAGLLKLCKTVEKYSEKEYISSWKTDLSTISISFDQKFPEDLIGLLRTLRNKLVHRKKEFDDNNLLNRYPDFFISLYDLAKDLSWKY